MKDAFLVTGPESSGSRFIHNLLQASGCKGVKYDWTFPHDGRDNEIFKTEDGYAGLDVDRSIVWHRSVPDGAHEIGPDNPLTRLFPPLEEMIQQLQDREFVVRLIVCVRDPYAIMQSQVSRHMASDLDDAFERMTVAYHYIFSVGELADSLIVASYDSLVTHGDAPRTFVELMGREFKPVEVKDGTGKYY